ncbi:MAG: ZIP family metal transporter [Patescibacteria group bacterium]
MIIIWIYTLCSVVAVSLVSFVGVVGLALNHRRLNQIVFVLVALATGALFGDVVLHLLPEIFAGGNFNLLYSLLILVGIGLFFSLEKFLHWRHVHRVENCDHNHPEIASPNPLGYLNLVSDGLHNLLDGLVIGASFLSGPAVGLATTIAVILHEIPQEIGDFGILIQAGFSRRRALWFNFLSAALAIIGAVIALTAGAPSEKLSLALLALAAGGFLYIAGSDLVPELHKTTNPGKSLIQLLALTLGVSLMFLLTFIE